MVQRATPVKRFRCRRMVTVRFKGRRRLKTSRRTENVRRILRNRLMNVRERTSIGTPCGRSGSSPTLQLIVMMLHVLAQLFSFTRVPFMSRKVWKTSVSPETSSQNRDVGGYRLRRLMLKMSVSPETSSENEDVEIGRETFGS